MLLFSASRPVLPEWNAFVFSDLFISSLIPDGCETRAVRQRPAMYIGSLGTDGIQALLFFLMDALIGRPSDSPTVRMGMDVTGPDIILRSNRIPENTVRDRLGIFKIANILCDEMRVIVRTAGGNAGYHFRNGKLLDKSVHLSSDDDVLELRLIPDRTIFGTGPVDYFTIFDRCRELAALNPGLALRLHGKEQINHIRFDNGLTDLLLRLSPPSYRIREPLSVYGNKDGVTVKASLIQTCFPDLSDSYVNNCRTREGGSHVEGFLTGLSTALNRFFRMQGTMRKFSPSSVKNRFNYLIAVELDAPEYAGSTKRRLQNREVRKIVSEIVCETVFSHLTVNQDWCVI